MRSVAVHDRRSARLTRHPVGPLGPDRGRWCAPPLLGSRWGRSRAPAGDRSSPGKRRAVRTWWAQPSRGGLMSVCAARVPRRPAAAPRGGTRRQRPVIAGVSALEERRVPVGYRASKGRSGRARPTLVAAGSPGVSLHRPDLGAIQGAGEDPLACRVPLRVAADPGEPVVARSRECVEPSCRPREGIAVVTRSRGCVRPRAGRRRADAHRRPFARPWGGWGQSATGPCPLTTPLVRTSGGLGPTSTWWMSSGQGTQPGGSIVRVELPAIVDSPVIARRRLGLFLELVDPRTPGRDPFRFLRSGGRCGSAVPRRRG